MEIFDAYHQTVLAIGVMAALLLSQLIIADVVGIKAKHKPGMPVNADHGNLLFRASRVVGNANDSVAVFILAVAFCILSGASPVYTAYAAWTYVILRILYAVCYYANVQTMRSAIFGISLVSLLALIGIGFFT
ncbi:MAG: MAPEG family protein [Pseudomonadota bacterium]